VCPPATGPVEEVAIAVFDEASAPSDHDAIALLLTDMERQSCDAIRAYAPGVACGNRDTAGDDGHRPQQ
jgi:hypothetical protein